MRTTSPPIAILDRYLYGQLFWTILFGIALFSIIWLAPDTLFKLIQYLFAKEITPTQALSMFMLHVPTVFQQSIPIAVLLGSLFVFQRLSQQLEVIALFAAGISPRRIGQSILWVGLTFGILHLLTQELIVPMVKPTLEGMYADLDLKETKDKNFVFVQKNRKGQLDKFFLIGQIQGKQLEDFIVLYYAPSAIDNGVHISRILKATTGHWSPENSQWKLVEGIEYVLNEEGVYQDIREFTEQEVRTSGYAAKLLEYSRKNPLSMDWFTLRRYIDLLEEGGQIQDIPYFNVILFQKITAPLTSVVFILLGAFLGMERVRSNRTYGLTYGVLAVFLYSVLTPFSTNLGSVDALPPWVVAWIPLVSVVMVALMIGKIRPSDS